MYYLCTTCSWSSHFPSRIGRINNLVLYSSGISLPFLEASFLCPLCTLPAVYLMVPRISLFLRTFFATFILNVQLETIEESAFIESPAWYPSLLAQHDIRHTGSTAIQAFEVWPVPGAGVDQLSKAWIPARILISRTLTKGKLSATGRKSAWFSRR